MGERYYGLDHLRALAIIMVMLFHYGIEIPDFLDPIRKVGWTGVDLFFVLSGFLIGNQLLFEIKRSGKINFKRFYLKRFFRIIPVYLVVLSIYFLIPHYAEGNGLPPLWRFITFTQNLGLDVTTQNSFSHAWSLCVEEHFYLLFPGILFILFFFKCQNKAPLFIILLLLVSLFYRGYCWFVYVEPLYNSEQLHLMTQKFVELIYYPTFSRIDGLVYGIAIAGIYNYKPKLVDMFAQYGNILLCLGLLILLFAFKICSHLYTFNNAIFGFALAPLGYAFLVIAALCPSCILFRVKSKISYFIATISYSVYLVHKLTYHWVKLNFVDYYHSNFHVWIFLLSLIIAVLVGYLLYLIIEKPFMHLRKRLLVKME